MTAIIVKGKLESCFSGKFKSLCVKCLFDTLSNVQHSFGCLRGILRFPSTSPISSVPGIGIAVTEDE